MRIRRTKHADVEDAWVLGAGASRRPAPALERGRTEPRAAKRARPFVLETARERHLLFSHDSIQSTMKLDAPDDLSCEYTRKMMAFLLFNPDPAHILMIGLGGGSLVKFCHRHLPFVHITAVEICADVIALRDEFLVPADNARFRVVHDDGSRFVAASSEPVDVVLVDAFDDQGVAPSLAASHFYADAFSRLNAHGVLVLNLSGEPSRYDAHLQRVHESFGNRTILLPVRSGENDLLFALKDPAPPAWDRLQSRAKDLQSKLALDFPRYLQLLISNSEAQERA